MFVLFIDVCLAVVDLLVLSIHTDTTVRSRSAQAGATNNKRIDTISFHVILFQHTIFYSRIHLQHIWSDTHISQLNTEKKREFWNCWRKKPCCEILYIYCQLKLELVYHSPKLNWPSDHLILIRSNIHPRHGRHHPVQSHITDTSFIHFSVSRSGEAVIHGDTAKNLHSYMGIVSEAVKLHLVTTSKKIQRKLFGISGCWL